ncbi:MAG: FxsA family protein [Sulfuriferula sp.]
MRLLLGFIIVLSFPALEIYTLVIAYQYIGWWVLVLLALSALVGMTLIAEERVAFFARMIMTIQNGGSPFRALFQSGRTMLAGGLLIFPGLISDVLALFVLLFPVQWFGRQNRATMQSGIIEGEFSREPNKHISKKS